MTSPRDRRRRSAGSGAKRREKADSTTGRADKKTRRRSRSQVVPAATWSKKTTTGRRGRSPETTARMRAPKGRKEEDQSEQQEDLDALKKDLDVASQVQVNLLPKKVPQIPGYDISAYYRPSKEVGGDYYDFITISPTRLGMVVADVSGKGIAGSMVMAMFRSVLRMCATEHIRARDTLIRANELATRDIKRGMFVTCFYMILNLDQNAVRVCSAGHNPMCLWRHKTNSVHLINPNGIAIGFDKGPVFDNIIKEQKFTLDPGDRVVIYTDGCVEAMNRDEEMFGENPFYRMIKHNPDLSAGKLINVLVEEIDRFADGAPQSDDITILTIRRDP